MIELHPDISTADGAMNSFVVHPEEGGPHPVLLLFMDAPGKREELHDMARRIEWYPGVEHGVMFPQRTGIYDREAAERHWERLFSLFARRLGRRPSQSSGPTLQL